MKKSSFLRYFTAQAQKVIHSPEGMKKLIQDLENFFRKKKAKSLFIKLGDDLKISFSLLKDLLIRNYQPESYSDVLLIIAGFLYLLNPLDFVPDFLLGGLIDDAAVLAWIFAKTTAEMKRYREFHKES